MSNDLAALATKAFIFGYPMVYTLTEASNQTTEPKVTFTAPVNMFGYGRTLAGPADQFVSLNNDTVYCAAHVDLTEEPQAIHLPDTRDRYYVMQCIDAWTNNFAYIGRRATGTHEQWWLFVGPNWQGTAPDGVGVVRSPTNVFTILGRFAVNGVDDLPAVHALQDDTWLTPLSRYPNRPDTSARSFGDHDLAPFDRSVQDDVAWWEKFRSWSQRFPPADPSALEPYRPLGVLESTTPYLGIEPALREALIAGQRDGLETIDRSGRNLPQTPVNGWRSAMHLFDYNTTAFQVGAFDAPEWKIADSAQATLVRAIAAMGGLWGNHGYEATYAWTFVDAEDHPLDGTYRYVVHFDELPPVDAFWSMTMYDATKYYLVDNPIARYSIGDRTPGLRYNADGSLDLYIQRDDPGGERTANWLPTPSGAFRPLIRMYQPSAAILDGGYRLPPLARVD